MKTIPAQRKGDSSDVSHHVDSSTQRQAHSNFVEASRRLLDINGWKEISTGDISTGFELNDSDGTKLDRSAKVGDLIRINIPGPGTTTGKGYDWVKIETIDANTDPTGDKESLAIRVRPASSPLNDEKDVAHFFDDSATSTFMIERNNLRVTASVHGRNELPNKDVERTTDKLRNTVVATAATSGMAALQWSLLVQGILKDL